MCSDSGDGSRFRMRCNVFIRCVLFDGTHTSQYRAGLMCRQATQRITMFLGTLCTVVLFMS